MAAWILALVLLPAAATANPSGRQGSVQVKVKADGTKVIFNESVAHRTRRTSTRLESPDPELAYLIELHARRQDLNPRLVHAVIQVESGFNPRALSSRGAQGLMQLMPTTARELGVENPYDAEQNVAAGTRYLRRQLNRFSDLGLALAAYNAGPTQVVRHGGIPPYRETRNYVRKVLSLLGLSGASRRPVATAELDRARLGNRRTADARFAAAPEETGTRSAPAPAVAKPGNRVYLSRGENNRIFVTTVPPKKSR